MMDVKNFALNQSQSYFNGITQLTSSINCQSPKSQISTTKLSENNPFYNDPLINSLLNKYNQKPIQSDTNIKNQDISSISTQLSPKSNYSPILFGQKQIQIQCSPLDTSQSKYSDIMSEQASNPIFNSYYLVDSQNTYQSPLKDAEKYKEEIYQLNKEVLRLKSINNELIQQNNKLTQRVAQCETQRNSDQQSIIKYENAILVLDQKVNQLDINLKQKNEELINLQISQQKEIEKEQAKLNYAFQMEKIALSTEIQNLKNSLKNIQMKTDSEMHQIGQNNQVNVEIQKLKQEYEGLKQENNILKDELIKRIEFENENKDITQMQQVLQQKNQEIDELQKSILMIHSQLEISQTSQNQLRQSQYQNEGQESLQQQLQEQQEMLMDQEQTIELLRSSLDNLNEKCKYQEEELTKCTQERDELREKYDQMKEDNLVLRISVSCKEKEYQELALKMEQQGKVKQNVVQRKVLTGSLDLRDLLK